VTQVFGRPLARNTDPVTSHMAARLTEPRADTNRALALQVLREHPDGLTDYELADLTGLQQNSIGKRRGELRDAGFVEDSGKRRKTPSGAQGIVWRVVRENGNATTDGLAVSDRSPTQPRTNSSMKQLTVWEAA